MKAYVDKETCIGCGLCPSISPEVFHMDDDGKAVAISANIPDELEGEAKDARDQCPVDAIRVE